MVNKEDKLKCIEEMQKKVRNQALETIRSFKDFEEMDKTSLLTIASVIESYKQEKALLGD